MKIHPVINLEKIKYNYSIPAKKWIFATHDNSYSILLKCGGKLKAERVARQVQAAVKRCGAMDNLGRAAIQKITG